MKRTERATIELAVTPEALVELLLDYGRYVNWLPDLSQSRTLAQEGDIAVVEFVAQRLTPLPVTFEFVHTEPQKIVFQQVGQLGERGLSGIISINPASVTNRTRLEIEACLQAPLHRFGIRRRLRETLDQVFDSLTAHLESQTTATAQADSESRRLVLQVRRLDGALEIWYQGNLFTSPLKPGETLP